MKTLHKLRPSQIIIWLTKSRMINGEQPRHQQIRSELVKGRSLLEDQDTDRRIVHYIAIEWDVLGCIYLVHYVYEEGAVVATVMNQLVS
jgi:hypothetical protein